MIFKDAFKFHMGTVAKITLFKFFLTIPKMVIGQWRTLLKKSKQESNWVRFLISITLPFLRWHNKVLKYISKDAFVMVTMWSEPYSKSSQRAFFVSHYRHRHIGYACYSYITFLQNCSKFAISYLIGILVYISCIYFDQSPTLNDLSLLDTPLVPMLYTIVTCYMISTVLMAPLDIILRSIIQSYAIDSEMFAGDQRYTEKFIQDFIDQFVQKTVELKKDFSAFGMPLCCKRKSKYDLNQVAPGDAEV